MKIIAILVVFVCCILMFVVRREYKVAMLVLGTVVFPLVSVPFLPLQNANFVLPLSFLLSECNNISKLIRNSKRKIVWKLTGIALLLDVITIIVSPHLHQFNDIRIFVQSDLFFRYFALLYAFWAFSSETSIKPVLQLTFWGMIVLTTFGVINYITKSADFVSAMMSGVGQTGIGATGNEAGSIFAERDRFRVQAMFLNPFDYGYVCILMLILHIYGYVKKYESKRNFWIVTACAIFGVVFCGCRTNIFCCLVGVSIFFLLAFKLGKSIKVSLMLVAIGSICYFYVPSVQETVDNMMTMFDKNSDVSGSSVELRTVQYAAVLNHIQDKPLFGCGYRYFWIDMGWGQGKEYLLDRRLAGLEGVVMSYLLERGFVGLFLYFLFYITIFVYFIKKRKYAPQTIAFGVSVLCVYLSFANMTGELNSVYPTILLLGYVFSVVDYNQLKSTISGGVKRVLNYILSQFSCRILKTAWVW